MDDVRGRVGREDAGRRELTPRPERGLEPGGERTPRSTAGNNEGGAASAIGVVVVDGGAGATAASVGARGDDRRPGQRRFAHVPTRHPRRWLVLGSSVASRTARRFDKVACCRLVTSPRAARRPISVAVRTSPRSTRTCSCNHVPHAVSPSSVHQRPGIPCSIYAVTASPREPERTLFVIEFVRRDLDASSV